MGLFSKKSEKYTGEKPIEAYKVVYKGGHPNYTKAKVGALLFEMFPDRFELKPTNATKWFSPLTIPYIKIADLKIVERQVGTAEGILGGLNSRQLNQANNIHISFTQNGQPIVLRLEMLTGVTVMGQAKKCLEFEDRLRTHGIREKFVAAQTSTAKQSVAVDNTQQISKYAALFKQGAITEAEYNAKKRQLLGL